MSVTETPTILDSLRKIAASRGISGDSIPKAARVRDEELIVCYSEGQGKFSQDRAYFSIHASVYKMDGSHYGSWSGENQILIPVSEIWRTLPQPTPPFNLPVPPVPDPQPDAYTKATWNFGDGNSLTVVGQAQLHAATIQNHETILWISSDQLVSYGSGRYEKAQGLKIGGVSALIPAGKTLDDITGNIKIKSFDVFRLALRGVIGPLPPLPGQSS